MAEAADLHPITRVCMGFHLWIFAGLWQHGDRMEAAVTAAVFAPLAMSGAGGGGCAPRARRRTDWRAGWAEPR
jgi:hypothetical protein